MWNCGVSKNKSAFVCCNFHICATLCSVTFIFFARISRRTFARISQLEQSGASQEADSRRWSSCCPLDKSTSCWITTKKHKSGNWLCVDRSQLDRFHKHKIVSPPGMSTYTYIYVFLRIHIFLSDPSPIIGNACHSLTDSPTDSLRNV